MYYDIVIAQGNENSLRRQAHKLGFTDSIVLYKPEEYKDSELSGIICSHTQARSARKKSPFVVVRSAGPQKDRLILEAGHADAIINYESGEKGDFVHHRNSGLNQVLCKLAAKNNIACGISLANLLPTTKRSDKMGRIMQNITFCRKYKVPFIFGSFASDTIAMRSVHDMISLATVLGMKPAEAKKSFQTVKTIISRNKRRQKELIAGVELAQ